MNTSPMSKDQLAMQLPMYSEAEGLEKINQHETFLAKATLDFVMYGDGGDKCDFMYDHLKDDTDGRYDQVHYLVWRFYNLKPNNDRHEYDVFSDLITFAEWAIEGQVWAMDRHFTNSITELLQLPQLSAYHQDIRTVWNNYIQLAFSLGFIICADFSLLIEQGTQYYNHDHYLEQRKKLFGELQYDFEYKGKVELFLRRNTNYPIIQDK